MQNKARSTAYHTRKGSSRPTEKTNSDYNPNSNCDPKAIRPKAKKPKLGNAMPEKRNLEGHNNDATQGFEIAIETISLP